MIEQVNLAFRSLEGRIWLNTAHQGPLPAVAVQAATEALAMKMAPHRIADAAFTKVPERLRTLLARVINASADEIVLGNSTS